MVWQDLTRVVTVADVHVHCAPCMYDVRMYISDGGGRREGAGGVARLCMALYEWKVSTRDHHHCFLFNLVVQDVQRMPLLRTEKIPLSGLGCVTVSAITTHTCSQLYIAGSFRLLACDCSGT